MPRWSGCCKKPTTLRPMPEAAELELIYQDDDLLVLNKPPGLLAVPGRGADKQDCLSSRVQQHFPHALVVHRLDMATSGLMLMALNAPMQRLLNHAFAQREVHKRYEALVQGHLQAAPGDDWRMVDLPIRVDWPRRPLRIIDAQGKPSTTRWRLLAHAQWHCGTPVSRLALEPITGRSHQLRVHLQALGHPILGDTLYGSPEVQALSPRMLLHASHLTLTHPSSGQRMTWNSPAPF